ncbi:RNA-binding (RRM/RBD/RNP motifs) family protein [Trifolium repens]|nr:RNA-binding (RRM/RBD/RNP motifs) family protein [Trifolium repens]
MDYKWNDVTKDYEFCGKEDDDEEPMQGNQEERGKRQRLELVGSESMEGGSSEVSNNAIMDMLKEMSLKQDMFQSNVNKRLEDMHSYNVARINREESKDSAGRLLQGFARGTVLDSHALILQFRLVKNDAKVQKRVGKGKSLTKLLVKNVAFEATKKDLRQLFSPFGQIKSLKLPMKFRKHSGFAFVEYVTQQEAENALTALSSTHLYSRHLVSETVF